MKIAKNHGKIPDTASKHGPKDHYIIYYIIYIIIVVCRQQSLVNRETVNAIGLSVKTDAVGVAISGRSWRVNDYK